MSLHITQRSLGLQAEHPYPFLGATQTPEGFAYFRVMTEHKPAVWNALSSYRMASAAELGKAVQQQGSPALNVSYSTQAAGIVMRGERVAQPVDSFGPVLAELVQAETQARPGLVVGGNPLQDATVTAVLTNSLSTAIAELKEPGRQWFVLSEPDGGWRDVPSPSGDLFPGLTDLVESVRRGARAGALAGAVIGLGVIVWSAASTRRRR